MNGIGLYYFLRSSSSETYRPLVVEKNSWRNSGNCNGKSKRKKKAINRKR